MNKIQSMKKKKKTVSYLLIQFLKNPIKFYHDNRCHRTYDVSYVKIFMKIKGVNSWEYLCRYARLLIPRSSFKELCLSRDLIRLICSEDWVNERDLKRNRHNDLCLRHVHSFLVCLPMCLSRVYINRFVGLCVFLFVALFRWKKNVADGRLGIYYAQISFRPD